MRRHAIWIILACFLLSGCRLGAVDVDSGDPVVLTGAGASSSPSPAAGAHDESSPERMTLPTPTGATPVSKRPPAQAGSYADDDDDTDDDDDDDD